MAKRLVSEGPRIVNRPLDGDKGSDIGGQAEKLKLEIQLFLESLGEASNEANTDIAIIKKSLGNTTQSGLHLFLLCGA